MSPVLYACIVATLALAGVVVIGVWLWWDYRQSEARSEDVIREEMRELRDELTGDGRRRR